jgi:Carboxypeptidase regulatory-like domain
MTDMWGDRRFPRARALRTERRFTFSATRTNQAASQRHPIEFADERPKYCRKTVGKHRSIIMNPRKKNLDRPTLSRGVWRSVFDRRSLLWISLSLLLCGFPALGQPKHSLTENVFEGALADSTRTAPTSHTQSPDQQLSGTISGTIVDATGAIVAGAHIKLSRENQSLGQDVVSDAVGQFSFANVSPGPFQLTTSSEGFATQTYSGVLRSGENCILQPIMLVVVAASTEVHVSLSRTQEAEAEIKDEEKQRVLGILPNFYVTYSRTAVPLSSKQKFKLAWKATVDPVNFVVVAGAAGLEQAANAFGGYGQGAQGYARRYGAAYGDSVTSTFIGSAILPSLFKQDPRYFYKGTGSIRSRVLYAIANSVICKGDNGRWQANYSAILGGLASSGISNLYYPAADREGAELTVQNALIGIGSSAATNILQEFVIRKLTRHPPNYAPPTPNAQ